MTITKVALEGIFKNADGSSASGTVCARLNDQLTNGSDVIAPSTVCGLLDGEGRVIAQDQLALELFCTDDAATRPIGATYTLTLSLDGEPPVEFDTTIPSNPDGPFQAVPIDALATTTDSSPVVQLVQLVAASTMVGATVAGNNVSGHVISVDTTANAVTLSADATATGVDGNFNVQSGVVSFNALRANAQS